MEPTMSQTDQSHVADSPLRIGADVSMASRLLVGTGKYASFAETARALEISGTEMVTVAVRRVNLDPSKGESLLDHVDRDRYHLLPNTAGCYDVDSALRTARLARELLDTPLVKLEVLGDPKTLLPDPIGTLEATKVLVEEGFTVMVYCSDDPRMGVRLAELGAAAVMPAGSPIGSGQGVLNPNAIRILMELIDVPVIVDAGVGTGVGRGAVHGARRGKASCSTLRSLAHGSPCVWPRPCGMPAPRAVKPTWPGGFPGGSMRTPPLRRKG